MGRILFDLRGGDPGLRFSPYCWRAKMALAHKGLAFDTNAVTFTEIEHATDGFSATVPVLHDGGTRIRDSFDIALYLDRTYPERPLFGDPAIVALARFVENWTFLSVNALGMKMIVSDIHAALDENDRAYFRQSREARLGRSLEEAQLGVAACRGDLKKALEPARRALSDSEWLSGAEPRFPDYILFGSLMWIHTISRDPLFAPDDPVGHWFERAARLYPELGIAQSAA
ncbi:Glutathione S-transferase [Faunimonas pinastri]|uniref:Glutathione S-transferase n=1 Tax=Faunimonas pinastri TaxID=1855383 RepID=A0A1H9CYF0_9HYPH|nr:glutathione S-transferase family protein [Faunimonas pinastri]SEQ06194.1 Glutathione S-transferase [Faunimonas pinastri]